MSTRRVYTYPDNRPTGAPLHLSAENVESPVAHVPALTGPHSASLLADETATLALVVAVLRALRVELDRCAGIDALGTPASYRLLLAMLDDLTGDCAGMLDTREWAEFDPRGRAA